jgi:hypothetical protein
MPVLIVVLLPAIRSVGTGHSVGHDENTGIWRIGEFSRSGIERIAERDVWRSEKAAESLASVVEVCLSG